MNKKNLEKEVVALVDQFGGEVSIYIKHPKLNLEFGINENKIMPTASLIKIPILIKIFDKIERNELSLDSIVYYYKDSINYKWKGADALSRFKDGEHITIKQLLTHMITFSDNTASLWLQKIAGGGLAINNWLSLNNFKNTRVNSRTGGRKNNKEKYGWGQTTAKEMGNLIIMIREGKIISKSYSEKIYRHLTRIYWDEEALSQIPPNFQVASKQGAVDKSRSEVVLVNAPRGDYAFCIITNNQIDTSWDHNNEGFILIRKISKILWKYFGNEY
tara:strand:- start:2528 stop:3349 length:822 start_codon:yes stop_codon:yes gene_type:complete